MDDRYRTNASAYQGSFSCSGVVGRVYRVTGTHYIINGSYTESRNNVTGELTKSYSEIYDTIVNNKNNTNKANLETIDILMKHNILSYDSAKKLVDDNKLNIDDINNVIEKYRS